MSERRRTSSVVIVLVCRGEARLALFPRTRHSSSSVLRGQQGPRQEMRSILCTDLRQVRALSPEGYQFVMSEGVFFLRSGYPFFGLTWLTIQASLPARPFRGSFRSLWSFWSLVLFQRTRQSSSEVSIVWV